MRLELKRRKREAGFTLIEMMVVIAVLAIVAAIAIPNFMTLLPGMRLNGAARQMMGELMAARMRAVKENRTISVNYLSNYEYSIIDPDNTVTKDIRDNYPKGVRFYHSTNNVTFYSRGNASGATLYLETTGGGQRNAVVVNITGRTKITSETYGS